MMVSEVFRWSKKMAGVEILVRVEHDFINFYCDSLITQTHQR